MKSTEFAYWLQGHFELSNPKTIDKTTLLLIEKHLLMVFKYEKKPSSFCNWLKGFIDNVTVSSEPDFKELSEKQTSTIQLELNNIFKHEIDPSYGGLVMQNDLNYIHNNGSPGEEVLRC